MRWNLVTPQGAIVRCVRPVDTATHPEYRRLGIFQKLTMAALEEARSDGVDLVFNTPNAQSGAGYRKMGWEDVQPIGAFVRPKRPWRKKTVATVADRSAFIPGGEDPQALDTPDRAAIGLRTVRSAEYRRWRFVDHPTAGYRMVRHAGGATMLRPNLREGRHEVVVSDVIGSVGRPAFAAAARAADSHYLVSWFSERSPERRAALASAYVPVPGLTALTQVALPLSELDRDVHDPANWDLSTGDLELL